MPKAIKKKAAKPVRKTEEEFKSVVTRAAHTAGLNWKRYVIALSVVLAAAALAAGVYFYLGGRGEKAAQLEYEGYRLYYGLYEKQPMIKAERLNKALESFKAASEIKKTPFSLYYVAGAHNALGNPDEAASALKELLRAFPGDGRFVPLAHYRLAVLSAKAGRPEEALKSLDDLYLSGVESYKDLALIESARLLEAAGKTDEAKKKYEAVIKDFPTSPFFDEANMKAGEKKG